MKLSENGKTEKIWFASLLAAVGLNTVMWTLTLRLDYDVSPGVFGRGALSDVTLCVSLVCVIIAVLPFFIFRKKTVDCGRCLSDTGRRGSEAAAFVACFIPAASVLTFMRSSDGGNRATAIGALVLSVPSAIYFGAVCLSRNQNSRLIRVCSLFTPLWAVFIILYHYLSTARAINDPVKLACQFMPVAVMLYAAAEMKTRLTQCSRGFFEASRALAALMGSIGLAMLIDTVVVLVSTLVTRLGGSVLPEFLVYSSRPHELALAAAAAGAAVYALSRNAEAYAEIGESAEAEPADDEKAEPAEGEEEEEAGTADDNSINVTEVTETDGD